MTEQGQDHSGPHNSGPTEAGAPKPGALHWPLPLAEPRMNAAPRQDAANRIRSEGEPHDALKLVDAEGVVKWFDARKGFGFIIGPEGQDIFAHFSVIKGDGFRVLRDGASVQYDALKTDKGWKATRVVRLGVIEVVVPPVKKGYTRTPRR